MFNSRHLAIFFSLLFFVNLDFTIAGSPIPYGKHPLQRRDWKVGQEVKTTSGTVIGHGANNRTQVSEYLGIPFAKPPVGELRWAAPVRFEGSGTVNASAYVITVSSDCAATFQDGGVLATRVDANPAGAVLLTHLMQMGQKVSEDCLTLNIWSKPQSGEKSKAVLFWIYGGGFATGNSNNPIYDGQYFADNEDVVVVSINYRLNIFGFPGLPGVDGVVQNPGLLDQRMAVEWVRDNIEKFGGDPKRITIFGESAGGASVDYYNYAYTQDPIIAGSIAQSGSVTSFSDPPPKNNSADWFETSKAVGCPTDDAKGSVACMRKKSMDEILNASRTENPLLAVLGRFGPTVDDKVVFGDYKVRAAAGDFIQKPYMAGSNAWEAGLFVLIGNAARIKIPENTWPVFNAATFNCPIARSVAARAKKGLTAYRYRYFGDYPNTELQPIENHGAWHTAEIPQIFMTTVPVTAEANTPSEAKLSKFMQQVWAGFAKDPTSLQKAPFNLPTYAAGKDFDKTIIGLGAYENVTHSLLPPIDYDSYCDSIESILETIPGGIKASFSNVALRGDMGIPGLNISDLPDMSPRPLPPYTSA